MKHFLLAATAFALAAPVVAQTNHQGMNHSMPMAPAGSLTAADVGVAPLTGTTPTDYVRLAADSDLYEMTSSKLALARSKDPAVRQYAQEMIRDHMTTTNALKAGVKRSKARQPATRLSSEKQAMIAQLRSAGTDFDRVYARQQAQSHAQAWALHKGFATDGADAPLREVAQSAVPIIERHVQHVRALPATTATAAM